MPTPSDETSSSSRPRARLAAAALGLTLPLLLALAPVGCGGEPGLAAARGRITYKGQPVSKGEVFFSPEEPGKRGAQGTLDENGYYTLGTFGPGDGAYVGKHQVSIVSQGADKPIPPKMKGKMMEEDMQGSGDPLIPRKYFSPATSGLTAEVVSGGSNTFDFDLKD
ncbi:MAG: hypothetical protein U0835_25055 [Isosphaeraceae bacterium]